MKRSLTGRFDSHTLIKSIVDLFPFTLPCEWEKYWIAFINNNGMVPGEEGKFSRSECRSCGCKSTRRNMEELRAPG